MTGVVAAENVREVAEDVGEGADQDGEARGELAQQAAGDRQDGAAIQRHIRAAGLGRVDSSNSPEQRSAGPSSFHGFRPR